MKRSILADINKYLLTPKLLKMKKIRRYLSSYNGKLKNFHQILFYSNFNSLMLGFINKILDWIKSKFFNKELEIAIVGLQNAGKTTLVKAITDGTFDQDTIPTIGFNHHQIKKGKISMKLWDLGGQAKFRDSWQKFCRDSDVIIFVVDSYDQTNIDMARAQLHELLGYKSLAGIPLLVLGNKNDIQGSLQEKEVVQRLDLTSFKDRTVACFSISAKSQNRLDVALKWLSDLKPKK